jgi:hypothetical protein
MRYISFIVFSLTVAASMLLSACAPSIAEKVVETVVIKEVVTQMVEKEAQTIVVTATPEPMLAAKRNSNEPTTQVSTQFTSILNPGEWTTEIIGPSSLEGGYVVDITPLNAAATGSYIEQKIIPEFDGEQWDDVLWMNLTDAVKPLKVRVQVFSTIDWPIAFEGLLDLKPGELHDFVIGDATLNGGYAVEVDPLEAGNPEDTFVQALVLPKFYGDWYDVLRIQIPASQTALSVNVRVYRTPDDIPVQAEFTVHLEPDDWVGFVLGDSKDRCAFIMEVTPLVDEANQIIFQVQQEFDGKDWKDVARLKIPSDFPTTDVLLRIYIIR